MVLATCCLLWSIVAAGPALGAAPTAPKLEDLPLVKTVTQYGITWTFDKEFRVGRFVTGDYYVVGPVTVKAINPAPAWALTISTSRQRPGRAFW